LIKNKLIEKDREEQCVFLYFFCILYKKIISLPTKWESNICMERDLFSYPDICRSATQFVAGEFLSTNHSCFVVYRGRYGIAGSPCRLLQGGKLVRIH